jgi:type I restriction enzyme M protein
VDIPDEEDDGIPFEDKRDELMAELGEQLREAEMLDREIKERLAKVGFLSEGL